MFEKKSIHRENLKINSSSLFNELKINIWKHRIKRDYLP